MKTVKIIGLMLCLFSGLVFSYSDEIKSSDASDSTEKHSRKLAVDGQVITKHKTTIFFKSN